MWNSWAVPKRACGNPRCALCVAVGGDVLLQGEVAGAVENCSGRSALHLISPCK